MIKQSKIKNYNWERVCIVGLGGHAINKIIPALNKIKLEIAGIVTSKKGNLGNNYLYFSKLENALSFFDEKTLFIISSPPIAHYQQTKLILKNGFDVMVEKPAFIYKKELIELIHIAKEKNLLLIEMFMYLESKAVSKIVRIIKSNKQKIKKISSIFTIPNLPANTFRDNSNIESSLLFDIGCYPLSLISFCDYRLSDINKKINIHVDRNKQLFKINIETFLLKFEFIIGNTNEYKNCIEITLPEDTKYFCEPFYHGVASQKEINFFDGNKLSTEIISENNNFEKLFNHKRNYWLKNQNYRFQKMLEIVNFYTVLIEYLEK